MNTLILKTLSYSRLDNCIVILRENQNLNIRFALNHITSSGNISSNTLTVISFKDKKVGAYSTQDFNENNLEQIVRKSEEIALQAQDSDDFASLIKPEDLKETADFPVKENSDLNFLKNVNTGLNKIFSWAKSKKLLTFGYIENTISNFYIGSTTGIHRSFQYNRIQFDVTAKSQDFKNSTWTGILTKNLTQSDFDYLINDLENKLSYFNNKLDLPLGLYNVILSPSATADMLIYRQWLADARSADEGRSLYSKKDGRNKVGEKVTAEFVNIYSDPTESGMDEVPFVISEIGRLFTTVSPYDNGADIKKTSWIKDGVLRNLTYTRSWAKKQGKKNPSFYAPNLIMQGSAKSLEDMIKQTKRGLLINSLYYIRIVNQKTGLLTGVTRDGVFVIENGKVIGVSNNFRWNMSLVDMFKNISDIGQSEMTFGKQCGEYFGFAKVPAVKVRDWNMSDVSEGV